MCGKESFCGESMDTMKNGWIFLLRNWECEMYLRVIHGLFYRSYEIIGEKNDYFQKE